MTRLVILVVMLLLVGPGCQQPKDGPGGAAITYLEALSARDAKGLYAILAPTMRKRLEALYNRMRRTRDLIEEHYPKAKQREALTATATAVLDKAQSPQGLFEEFVGASGTAATLNRVQKLGLRIKEVAESGDEAEVTTLGGDVVQLVKVEDQWFVTLGPSDISRLQQLETDAERNLGRVRQQVAALRKRRFGGATK